MNLRLPSDPALAQSIQAAWPEMERKLSERARPAVLQEPLDARPSTPKDRDDGSDNKRDWREMLKVTAARHKRIRELSAYGVEPEHLAERFGMTVKAIHNIINPGMWYDE